MYGGPPLDEGFHYKDGWMFLRLNDGSVRIAKIDQWAPIYGSVWMEIDPHSWASIVASMSKEGETSETYYAALERQLP